jgi:thiol:disulfide interchange protein DsbD
MDIPGGSLTLLGIFLLGLGLNLTPCVYPMLTVTVSLFGGQKETHHWRAFGKAVIYVLGMATMYSLLGVGAAVTGELFGSLLQNRWVLIANALIIFVLSLSLFGLYTFQLPSRVLTRLGGKRHVTLLGIYLAGLFVGIFAAPCIGPPIIGLLTFVGPRGDPLFAFWTFFVMSLGLGAPYLVLGTFSSLLHKLPRAGVWLVWVERAFGVFLLSLSAFYLILAFNPSWLKWWGSLSLILGGIYLGFVESAGDQLAIFKYLKRLLGAAAVILGLSFFLTIESRPGLVWEAYAPQKLEAAVAQGKPAIVDFYADWCIPCHELEHFTYSDPRVQEALQGFAKIKVDVTRADTPQAEEAIQRFGIFGVPTILFLDREGREVEEARVTGFIPPDDLLEILRSPDLQLPPETED